MIELSVYAIGVIAAFILGYIVGKNSGNGKAGKFDFTFGKPESK